MTARAVTLLPEPDSRGCPAPTPHLTLKLMPLTAITNCTGVVCGFDLELPPRSAARRRRGFHCSMAAEIASSWVTPAGFAFRVDFIAQRLAEGHEAERQVIIRKSQGRPSSAGPRKYAGRAAGRCRPRNTDGQRRQPDAMNVGPGLGGDSAADAQVLKNTSSRITANKSNGECRSWVTQPHGSHQEAGGLDVFADWGAPRTPRSASKRTPPAQLKSAEHEDDGPHGSFAEQLQDHDHGQDEQQAERHVASTGNDGTRPCRRSARPAASGAEITRNHGVDANPAGWRHGAEDDVGVVVGETLDVDAEDVLGAQALVGVIDDAVRVRVRAEASEHNCGNAAMSSIDPAPRWTRRSGSRA